MNAKRTSLILTTCLGLFAAPAAKAAEMLALVDANFNTSTTRVASYPPDSGVRFTEMAPGFSGWATGGQIRLTQNPGYGVDQTGGIFVEILKAPNAKFYQIMFQRLKFTMLGAGAVIRDPIRSLQFSIDAKIPAGKEILVYVAIDPPKEYLAASPWSTRLVLGKIVGTDAFKSYVLKSSDIPEATVDTFINFIRELQANGMDQTVGSLVLHLEPTQWVEGDGLVFDNVKLEIAAR